MWVLKWKCVVLAFGGMCGILVITNKEHNKWQMEVDCPKMPRNKYDKIIMVVLQIIEQCPMVHADVKRRWLSQNETRSTQRAQTSAEYQHNRIC